MRLRPSPAIAISSLALFIALGGASYAAVSLPSNSVGNAQIRNDAVSYKKIRPNSVGWQRANITTLQDAGDGDVSGRFGDRDDLAVRERDL